MITGEAYIIVTIDDGVVFKIVKVLSSLNPLYKPYEIEINKVKETWKFKHYISSQLPEPVMNN